MAMYEYHCEKCDEGFTLMRPMAERDKPAKCPSCGKTGAKRALSLFATSTGGGSGSAAGDCAPGFG